LNNLPEDLRLDAGLADQSAGGINRDPQRFQPPSYRWLAGLLPKFLLDRMTPQFY